MSATTKKEKWIIKDANGDRHGTEIYESKKQAQNQITKLCESGSKGTSQAGLKSVQLLTE